MEVTQTQTDGLKREFKVVIPADDIKAKVDRRLSELSRTVRLPGFRPGKVPITMLRQRFGQSVLGEVVERAVSDASSQTLTERGLKPAAQPKVDILSFSEGKDLEYTLAVELLPEITPMNFAELDLERLKAEPSDDDVMKAIERLAESNRATEKIADEREVRSGDIAVIDFAGTVDGKSRPGMDGKEFKLEIGSNTFIPGFESQIAGMKPGERRDINVTFPENYNVPDLVNKAAVFDVTLKEIHQVLPVQINDELAKKMGLEDLDGLKKAVRDQIMRDFTRVSRNRLKRSLLDKLAEKHDFPVPAGMVDLEFNAIWRSVEETRKQGVDDPTITGRSDDELKEEMRGIAARRVRLGLLLSEVGRVNNIQVSQDEINRALVAEAQRFPGQERRVMEYYRNNNDALAQLRAPLFEDKVVDFILELAKVDEKQVEPTELMRDPEEDAAAPAKGAETSGGS
jgi:trigger factor